jgi:hypothetical protein
MFKDEFIFNPEKRGNEYPIEDYFGRELTVSYQHRLEVTERPVKPLLGQSLAIPEAQVRDFLELQITKPGATFALAELFADAFLHLRKYAASEVQYQEVEITGANQSLFLTPNFLAYSSSPPEEGSANVKPLGTVRKNQLITLDKPFTVDFEPSGYRPRLPSLRELGQYNQRINRELGNIQKITVRANFVTR